MASVMPSAHQKPHGPVKFYGGALPRPRFHTDGSLFADRVEPVPPVTGPLMQWAYDAHWSMGGLSFKHLRLQGRIEGNVEKLRVQREKTFKSSRRQKHQQTKLSKGSDSDVPEEEDQDSGSEVSETPSPLPSPLAIKRRRVVGLLDEEEPADAGETNKRVAVRKLSDQFERVSSEGGMSVDEIYASDLSKGEKEKTKRTRKLVKGGGKVGSSAAAGVRKSLRLLRNRLN